MIKHRRLIKQIYVKYLAAKAEISTRMDCPKVKFLELYSVQGNPSQYLQGPLASLHHKTHPANSHHLSHVEENQLPL